MTGRPPGINFPGVDLSFILDIIGPDMAQHDSDDPRARRSTPVMAVSPDPLYLRLKPEPRYTVEPNGTRYCVVDRNSGETVGHSRYPKKAQILALTLSTGLGAPIKRR